MGQIVSVHSFRRGVGKTMIAANIATLWANQGLRVGVIDLNLLAPSQHILFGLPTGEMGYTLNDFVWGNCPIEEVAYGLPGVAGNGRLYLIPASTEPRAIARIWRGGYYVNFIADACHSLMDQLALDMLVLDNYAGLGEEMQLAMALADVVLVIMRPEMRDYVGSRTILALANYLAVPATALVVNGVARGYELTAVADEVARVFACPVSAVLPHLDEIMLLGSAGLFVQKHKKHWATDILQQLSWRLTPSL